MHVFQKRPGGALIGVGALIGLGALIGVGALTSRKQVRVMKTPLHPTFI